MIRIIRVLEYTYQSYEQAEADMRRWQVPPTGTAEFGNRPIRSAIVPPTTFEQKDD